MILLLLMTYEVHAFLPTTFSAQYEESYKSAAAGVEKKSTGTIDYKYPRHIRLEVKGPDQSVFVANPKNSWYYTPPFIEGEEGQVVLQHSDDLVMTKFLDTLKHGAKSNKAYRVLFNQDRLTLRFSEVLKKDLQMDGAVLRTKSGGQASKAKSLSDFAQLDLLHSNGRHVTMKFLEFKTDVTFVADHFVFQVPAKTRITEGK